MVTVFTPTYNRAYCLGRLYKSLAMQTDSDFEWLIVDDGSNDDTGEMIKGFISEGKIGIKYLYQENAGKHVAINAGSEQACGELFFVVDSDDELTNDAIALVNSRWPNLRMDSQCVGMCFARSNKAKDVIICPLTAMSHLDCSTIDAVYRYKLVGDKAEIFRTDLIRENKFPVYRGEKFVTEALVWHRISYGKYLRYYPEAIYICSYLPDGLTACSNKLHKSNPKGMLRYYWELLWYKLPIFKKIKALVWILYYFLHIALNILKK